MTRAAVWDLVKTTAEEWSEDNASRLAAALAYYTLLSIAPLVVIAIGVAGFVFGEQAARGQIAEQLSDIVGARAAEGIQVVIAHARAPETGIVSTTIGVVVLLFGASAVFGELQTSLNAIWEVRPRPGRGILGIVRDRFLSFTMVLGVAFLLLVSLIVSAALSAAGHFFESALPAGELVWQALNSIISIGTITLLFALIFRVIPDADVAWRDVWVGASVTAFLFTLGKFLLGYYLGRSAVTSSYGAAGSLVGLAIWVYYATQILFLGAEFTQVQAKRRGAAIAPSRNAVAVESAHPRSVSATASDAFRRSR
jgi:membrane protein